MCTMRSHRQWVAAAGGATSLWAVAAFCCDAGAQSRIPPPDFTVAFIGDQGLGSNAEDVLTLIDVQEADVVVHSGDFDYNDDPQAWDNMISGILGPCFPYFASVGNHDDSAWDGPDGYQSVLEARMNCLGIPWDGDLGERSSHTYQGILFVLTAPDVFGDGDTEYAPYISEQLAASDAVWRISSWHKMMEAMQVGGKSDETGWDVYEESRRGGAIVATGHEHSYARTHPLADCENQVVDSTENTFAIARDHPETPDDEGVTFVFHNGLGGKSIRDQERCFPTEPPYGCNGEWASIYAEQQGADYGALFGVFNYDGDPCQARFYFMDISGSDELVDEFFVVSTVGRCPCPADFDDDGSVNVSDLLTLLGSFGQANEELDLDGDGVLTVTDLLILLAAWGECPAY